MMLMMVWLMSSPAMVMSRLRDWRREDEKLSSFPSRFAGEET